MSSRGVDHTARRHLMESLGERDCGGCNCCYCGTPLRPYGEHSQPTSPTLDHMTPTVRGGSDAIENLALACHHCNALKGGLTAKEFRAALAVRESA